MANLHTCINAPNINPILVKMNKTTTFTKHIRGFHIEKSGGCLVNRVYMVGFLLCVQRASQHNIYGK